MMLKENSDKKLDVIIPVYMEGPNIVRTLETLFRSNKSSFNVVIVYDNEDDNTLPAVKSLSADLRGRIVFLRNKGKGAHGAVCTGFENTSSPAVVVYPADDDYNEGLIDRLRATWLNEKCDIVCASRFIKGGCMIGAPFLKNLFVRMSAFTLYHFGHLPTRDPSNGLRLFSRRVLKEFKIESTRGFTYSIELLIKTFVKGWKIGEVPAKWFERRQGQSRFKILKWLPEYLLWYFYGMAAGFSGGKN